MFIYHVAVSTTYTRRPGRMHVVPLVPGTYPPRLASETSSVIGGIRVAIATDR